MTDTDLGSLNDDEISPATPQPGTVIDVNSASKHANKFSTGKEAQVNDEEPEITNSDSNPQEASEPVSTPPKVVPITVGDSSNDDNQVVTDDEEQPKVEEDQSEAQEVKNDEVPDETEQTLEAESPEAENVGSVETEPSTEDQPNTNQEEELQEIKADASEPLPAENQQTQEQTADSVEEQLQEPAEQDIAPATSGVDNTQQPEEQLENADFNTLQAQETAPPEINNEAPPVVPASKSEFNTEEENPSPEPEEVPKIPAQSVAETDAAIAAANSAQPLKGKKSKKKRVILIVILLILAAIGAAAFVFQDELIKQYDSYFNKEATQELDTDANQDETLPVIEEPTDEETEDVTLTPDDDLKENVNKIHTELELQYVDNATYPSSLAEIEDDLPEGIVDSEEYIYVPTPLECSDDCSGYTLFVTLSDDTIFERNSINE